MGEITRYRLKESEAKKEKILLVIKDEHVNLAGTDYEYMRPAVHKKRRKKIVYRAATQEDFRYLMEDDPGNWNHKIESFTETIED